MTETTFMISKPSIANAPLKTSMYLENDVANVAKIIEASILNCEKPMLIWVAVNNRFVPIKSAQYQTLFDTGLFDHFSIKVFDSFKSRDWFKKAVCERVAKEKAKQASN